MGIVQVYQGGIGSYALLVMILTHLQVRYLGPRLGDESFAAFSDYAFRGDSVASHVSVLVYAEAVKRGAFGCVWNPVCERLSRCCVNGTGPS